jgi:hypothetical protein
MANRIKIYFPGKEGKELFKTVPFNTSYSELLSDSDKKKLPAGFILVEEVPNRPNQFRQIKQSEWNDPRKSRPSSIFIDTPEAAAERAMAAEIAAELEKELEEAPAPEPETRVIPRSMSKRQTYLPWTPRDTTSVGYRKRLRLDDPLLLKLKQGAAGAAGAIGAAGAAAAQTAAAAVATALAAIGAAAAGPAETVLDFRRLQSTNLNDLDTNPNFIIQEKLSNADFGLFPRVDSRVKNGLKATPLVIQSLATEFRDYLNNYFKSLELFIRHLVRLNSQELKLSDASRTALNERIWILTRSILDFSQFINKQDDLKRLCSIITNFGKEVYNPYIFNGLSPDIKEQIDILITPEDVLSDMESKSIYFTKGCRTYRVPPEIVWLPGVGAGEVALPPPPRVPRATAPGSPGARARTLRRIQPGSFIL